MLFFLTMDALRRDDLERAQHMPPEVRAAHALEAMRLGFRIRRMTLRDRNPGASEERLDELFREWLARDR